MGESSGAPSPMQLIAQGSAGTFEAIRPSHLQFKRVFEVSTRLVLNKSNRCMIYSNLKFKTRGCVISGEKNNICTQIQSNCFISTQDLLKLWGSNGHHFISAIAVQWQDVLNSVLVTRHNRSSTSKAREWGHCLDGWVQVVLGGIH